MVEELSSPLSSIVTIEAFATPMLRRPSSSKAPSQEVLKIMDSSLTKRKRKDKFSSIVDHKYF